MATTIGSVNRTTTATLTAGESTVFTGAAGQILTLPTTPANGTINTVNNFTNSGITVLVSPGTSNVMGYQPGFGSYSSDFFGNTLISSGITAYFIFIGNTWFSTKLTNAQTFASLLSNSTAVTATGSVTAGEQVVVTGSATGIVLTLPTTPAQATSNTFICGLNDPNGTFLISPGGSDTLANPNVSGSFKLGTANAITFVYDGGSWYTYSTYTLPAISTSVVFAGITVNAVTNRTATASLTASENTIFIGAANQTLTLPSAPTQGTLNYITNSSSSGINVAVVAGAGDGIQNPNSGSSLLVSPYQTANLVYIGNHWVSDNIGNAQLQTLVPASATMTRTTTGTVAINERTLVTGTGGITLTLPANSPIGTYNTISNFTNSLTGFITVIPGGSDKIEYPNSAGDFILPYGNSIVLVYSSGVWNNSIGGLGLGSQNTLSVPVVSTSLQAPPAQPSTPAPVTTANVVLRNSDATLTAGETTIITGTGQTFALPLAPQQGTQNFILNSAASDTACGIEPTSPDALISDGKTVATFDILSGQYCVFFYFNNTWYSFSITSLASLVSNVPVTTAQNTVAPTADSIVTLTLSETTGAPADILDIKDASGNPLISVLSNGVLQLNTLNSAGLLHTDSSGNTTTSKIATADLAAHPVSLNQTLTPATPSATINTNGTSSGISLASGMNGLTYLSSISLVYASLGVETVTSTITAIYDNVTSSTVTDSNTVAGTDTISAANLASLLKDGHAITSLTVMCKSSIASSTATVTMSVVGIQTP